MVRVGSARHDEHGKTKGGAAGDQTGHEVETQKWYKHSKGWVVIRPKSAEAREKIAQDMEYACDNPNIGYDQSQNGTLFNAAKKVGFDCSKVEVKCETDCSRLVRVCCWYAGIEVPVFYTGNQVETLQKTGKFEILTSPKYTESSDYLLRGDILVTKTTGHTVVVLDNGAKAGHPTIKKGAVGSAVVELQQDLNYLGYRDKRGKELKVDGEFKTYTDSAVRNFQKDQGLKVDGSCGPKTWARIDDLMKKSYRVVANTNVWCRTTPEKTDNKIRLLQKGHEFIVSRESGDWSYIPNERGWSMSQYLSKK